MRKEDSFRDFVLDQLRTLEGIACRSMFGGYGLYLGADFFGIIYDGRLYFKTDEETRLEYRDRGMGPFAPGEEQVLKSYYEVPEEIVEDDEELASWARVAATRKGRKKGMAPGRNTPKKKTLAANRGGWKTCSRGHKYRGAGPCSVCWPGRKH